MVRTSAVTAALLLAAALCISVNAASTEFLGNNGRMLLGDHKYKKGDEIMLYANKVGPFQNPT